MSVLFSNKEVVKDLIKGNPKYTAVVKICQFDKMFDSDKDEKGDSVKAGHVMPIGEENDDLEKVKLAIVSPDGHPIMSLFEHTLRNNIAMNRIVSDMETIIVRFDELVDYEMMLEITYKFALLSEAVIVVCEEDLDQNSLPNSSKSKRKTKLSNPFKR